MDEPRVERVDGVWSQVRGGFSRAVDPEHRDRVLDGSRGPGRYSSAEQPTLYLSSSPEGVAAAMAAHHTAGSAGLLMVTVEVEAARIVDLRDRDARHRAGVDLRDAVSPWQEVVKAGGEPPSWRVRRRLELLGANGLIDPSRRAPGLWHLTLFRWNRPGGPSVRLTRPGPCGGPGQHRPGLPLAPVGTGS